MVAKELNRFLKEYNDLRNIFFREKISKIGTALNPFLRRYAKQKVEFKKRDKKNASEFNIFELLKFSREEEQLHSQILSNLLNPKGKHSQGTIFYNKFIDILGICPKNAFLVDSDLDIDLTIEKSIKSLDSRKGRIDLLINGFSRQGNRFSIIIENKWNANLSSYDQLFKYYKSVVEYGIDKDKVVLIYLSKKGKSPDESLVSKVFLQLQSTMQKHRYFNLSYEDDIINWLDECLNICESSDVETAIKHYILYLKNNL